MNLPNKLSLFRIILIPFFVLFYFLSHEWAVFVALFIFVLAAFTDFLDGYIARKYNLVTDLGKLLDPIADKVLVCAALFCLVATNPLAIRGLYFSPDSFAQFTNTFWQSYGYVVLAVGSAIILARELLISAVRQVAATKGVVLQANIFGKIKTILQDITIPVLIVLQSAQYFVVGCSYQSNAQFVFYNVMWFIGIILFGLTVFATIFSGVVYIVQNRKVFNENVKECND